MSLYRKKPVVVDVSEPLNGRALQAIAFARQFDGDAYCGKGGEWHIVINTLEGRMRADKGDRIITGVHGEFYPCKRGIFEETYEAVRSMEGE